MAKAPQKKQEKQAALTPEKEQMMAEARRRLERYKVREYEDLLKYIASNQSDSDPTFATQGTVSAYDVASTYYGDQAQSEMLAAAEYAKRLQKNPEARVVIPPEYYEKIQERVPVEVGRLGPYYDRVFERIEMPTPIRYKESEVFGEKMAIKNNYNPQAVTKEAVEQNLMRYWQSDLEHESGHIADRLIKIKPDEKITAGEFNLPLKDLGYMSKDNHLVTGLGKVQREHYSQTGRRFDSPEEFKQFLFSLSKEENLEEAISAFSEEAKRTLRYQVENAARVKKSQDAIDAWKKSKSWFKGPEPEQFGNPFLLEKSAQLIPALVQTGTRNKSSV